MRRALFAREFRTALVPNLVTVGAILGTLVVVERLYGLRVGSFEDIRVFTDVVLLVGLVGTGFISGERCFPTELKESRLFFLYSLPISRSSAWLAIVSARLLAALTSQTVAITLRRPLLEGTAPLIQLDVGLIAFLALFAYILFFSAGTMLALLYRRTLFSYAAGFLLLGLLLFETLLSSSYAALPPTQLRVLVMPPILRGVVFDGSRLPPFLIAFLSLLLASFFLLSWSFFVRGEFGNPKRRVKNQFLFGMTVTAYLGIVFCITSSTRMVLRGDQGAIYPYAYGRAFTHGVSPSGKYVFVFEWLHYSQFMVQVTIEDARTGRVVSQSVYGGASWGYWSGPRDVLNLLVLNNSPLNRWGYLIPGTVDWIRLSPEAQEISKVRLKGVEEIEILASGRAVVVLRDGGLGRVLLLNGADGRSSEVARAPLDGEVVVRGDGMAAVVYFENVIEPRRAWVIDSLVREVRVPRSILKNAYVLFGEVFGSSAEAQAALLRRFASPVTPGGAPIRGSFLLPPQNKTWILSAGSEMKAIYFLEDRAPTLWVRSTWPEGRWKKLPDLALDSPELFTAGFLVYFVDFTSGAGFFLTRDQSARQSFIYDPRLGIILKGAGCTASEKTSLSIQSYQNIPGLRGNLIGFNCTEKTFPYRRKIRYFEHQIGLREVRSIKTVPDRGTFSRSHLYFDERGWEVFVSPLDQEIWRSSPEMKDLRLWPPVRAAKQADDQNH